MMPVQEFKTAEEILENARRVHQRRQAAYRAPPPPPKPAPVVRTLASRAKGARIYPEPIGPVRVMGPWPVVRDIIEVGGVDQPSRIAWTRVFREVCEKYGLTAEDIKSPSRIAVLISPRRELAYRLKTECNMSFPRIAGIMDRDHSTILHAYRSYIAKGVREGKIDAVAMTDHLIRVDQRKRSKKLAYDRKRAAAK
jgi:hypothetical protein